MLLVVLQSFPPYAEGPLYVLSSGLAQDLPFTMEKHGDEVSALAHTDLSLDSIWYIVRSVARSIRNVVRAAQLHRV